MDKNKKLSFPIDIFSMSLSIKDLKLSPKGDKIAYVLKGCGKDRLMIYSIENGISKQLTWKPEIACGFGGAYAWSNDSSFIVYRDRNGQLYKIPSDGGNATQLTFDNKYCAVPTLSPDDSKILYGCEDKKTSYLAYVGTNGKTWSQNIGADSNFIQDPAWSPDGKQIAWMGYNNPYMPWDSSRIYIGDLQGNYKAVSFFSKNDSGSTSIDTLSSSCQPRWSPNGKYLAFVCDKTGYMNLWLTDKSGENAECMVSIKNDVVYPSWGSGNVNYAWSEDESYIVFTVINEASNNLYKYDLNTKELTQLTDDGGNYSSINLYGNKVYCIYENAVSPPEAICLDIETKSKKVLISPSIMGIEKYALSRPVHINWKNKDGKPVYGLFYQSKNIKREPAPLLIYVHGGPTGLAMDSWNLKMQFFTSRGWNVLAVNYRGSGGYGRDYLQALRGNWGVYDVEDCKSGAKHLIRIGKAKEDLVAIQGGSAGGYTVLMSLATEPGFYKAGISFYGVTDLYEITLHTHRLEAHYNDNLIGELPECKDKYWSRSPVNLVKNITNPVLVLQGDKDKVVNKEQAEDLVEKLKHSENVYEYELYEGEGHGFSFASEPKALKRCIDFLNKYVINS